MPISKTLVLASALTLTLQFLIFAYLYSSHRVRFFRYLLLAWGLMSVAKLLHAGQILVPDLEILGALINTAFVGATLLVLAGGLAFRFDYQIRRRDLVIGGLAALGALSLGDLADASVAARSLAGFVTGGILILAGVQFWPRAAQPRYRGACFLATSLALWGVHRIVSPAFPAEPGTAPHLMMHLGFMLFYFLSTFAIIIMVLDRARSETAALKEFNERLVDGLGEGLQLVDGDFRIRHANRWMHGQFGPVVGRRCYELLAADGMPCPGCPLDRRHEIGDAVRIEVAGTDRRRFSLSCSPVRQPDGQIFLLELVADVTEPGSDLRWDYSAVGTSTHIAARMEQLASPGATALTAETLALVEEEVSVRPLGRVVVKGLPDGLKAYELVGLRSARGPLAPAGTLR